MSKWANASRIWILGMWGSGGRCTRDGREECGGAHVWERRATCEVRGCSLCVDQAPGGLSDPRPHAGATERAWSLGARKGGPCGTNGSKQRA